jgi:hypothetical protein
MEWQYLNLVNGRLVDDDGNEANRNWPSFGSWDEANDWLEENNIRATLR